MRFRLLLLLGLPALLTACSKTDAPVRLDLIGNSTLTSGNRTAAPGDTLTTRAYAVGTDHNLAHLRITVKYEPTRTPFLYPVPATSYNPKNTPDDDELVYLDSTLTTTSANYTGRELLFQNKYAVRTTSGTELWQYTATDTQGQTAVRALRVTVRKGDSLAVFHNYSAVLRPAPPVAGAPTPAIFGLRDQARAFLNLRAGLVLPKYALLSQPGNQPLVDLVCVASATGISLDAPAANSLVGTLNASRWPRANRQSTRLVSPALSPPDFGNARTTASFSNAYTNGTPLSTDTLSTGPLAKNKVLAFRTSRGLSGLILVADLVVGTSPVLNCSVKVQKL